MADYLTLSDEALLALCKADDEKAWNTLFERYLPTACKLASRVRHEFLEGQDLAAEGMIGLLSAVYTYSPDGKASFSTYAYACMQNRMRNCLRSVQGKKQIPPSKLIPMDAEFDSPFALSPEETLLSKQQMQQIDKIVETALSARERTVFLLFANGSSYQQIAAQTGLSLKAVDTALQRARKKLREQLS